MKRINNLYAAICSMENLRLADSKAQKGKAKQYGVIVHNRNKEANLQSLHEMLVSKTYSTSPYSIFKIFEPKEREVFRLPYFPDRITHHAVMNLLEPMFMGCFVANSYSCIKGKGIHAAANDVREALRDEAGTTYCLKLDIKKFYPSVDHDILKALLRRKIKDRDLLWLLDEIIDSADGLPIGNYLSQYLANFYLTYFDHWLKEQKQVKYYFRYADDIVILHSNKEDLHTLRQEITQYLQTNLKLTIKENYRVFPITTGLDFLGYVFYPTHTRLRKRIKQRFARMLKKRPNRGSIASYWGWAKHCNSTNLIKKLLTMTNFRDLGITVETKSLQGDKIKIDRILNKEIKVEAFKIEPSKFPKPDNDKCLWMQILVEGDRRIVFSSSIYLREAILQVPKHAFPVTTTIVKIDEALKFT